LSTRRLRASWVRPAAESVIKCITRTVHSDALIVRGTGCGGIHLDHLDRPAALRASVRRGAARAGKKPPCFAVKALRAVRTHKKAPHKNRSPAENARLLTRPCRPGPRVADAWRAEGVALPAGRSRVLRRARQCAEPSVQLPAVKHTCCNPPSSSRPLPAASWMGRAAARAAGLVEYARASCRMGVMGLPRGRVRTLMTSPQMLQTRPSSGGCRHRGLAP
jgi:hypothetical protein